MTGLPMGRQRHENKWRNPVDAFHFICRYTSYEKIYAIITLIKQECSIVDVPLMKLIYAIITLIQQE